MGPKPQISLEDCGKLVALAEEGREKLLQELAVAEGVSVGS